MRSRRSESQPGLELESAAKPRGRRLPSMRAPTGGIKGWCAMLRYVFSLPFRWTLSYPCWLLPALRSNWSPGLSLSCPPSFLDTLRHRLATRIRIMLYSSHHHVPFSASARACPSHVERTSRRNVITPLTLSTQDPKTPTKWSSQVRGTSKGACPSQTASTPTPTFSTIHPRTQTAHHLKTPSHTPPPLHPLQPFKQNPPSSPPTTNPPATEQHPTRRRPPRANGQTKKGPPPAHAGAAAQPPPEAAAAAAVESLPKVRDADDRVPRPRRV